MTDTENTIQSLLHHVALLVERDRSAKQEAQRRGELFNVFRLCGINHYENAHSAILAEWLNPAGSHGQGDLFLKLFLRAVAPVFAEQFCTEKATVATEYAVENGRFDLLIADPQGNAVIIENKIYAGDQCEQLKRYDAFARQTFHSYRLLYLTLEGTEASGQSGDGVDYVPISYSRTILLWMEDCIRAVYDKPYLRESLMQYKNLIEQLTGQNMEKTIEKELLVQMQQSPEGVVAIVNAYPEWENLTIRENLFKPLEQFSEERGLRFSADERFWSKNSWGSFGFEVRPNLWILFQYENQGRRNFYYGITDSRPDKKEMQLLPSLTGGDENWPYGWRYLEGDYLNWTPETILILAKNPEELLQHIENIVNRLYVEMEEYNII